MNVPFPSAAVDMIGVNELLDISATTNDSTEMNVSSDDVANPSVSLILFRSN